MRDLLVLLHRWFGLASALFLFIAGATGAVISWDHELDAWLNPHLYKASTSGRHRSALDLAAAVEAADPRVRVTFLPYKVEPGHALAMSVEPRIDPSTDQPFEIGYNQVAVDPVTGAIQGRREWGKVSLERENLLPFLYKLHYSMHIPTTSNGVELGVWLMGVIAIVWVFDTLIALWISFPNLGAWKRSFAFRWKAGGHRLTFDLHRSGGVWAYPLVLMIAVTSVGMNLREPVLRPVVGWFSNLSPSPLANRSPSPPSRPIEPAVTPQHVIDLARAEAQRLGWTKPFGGLFLSTELGLWGVGFFEPGNPHGDGGLGNAWLYFDSRTGEKAGTDIPGVGSAGDIFLQSMFPLHSGRMLGTPGRVLMSLMGIAIATLSATGVLIWARKRAGRRRSALPAAITPSTHTVNASC